MEEVLNLNSDAEDSYLTETLVAVPINNEPPTSESVPLMETTWFPWLVAIAVVVLLIVIKTIKAKKTTDLPFIDWEIYKKYKRRQARKNNPDAMPSVHWLTESERLALEQQNFDEEHKWKDVPPVS